MIRPGKTGLIYTQYTCSYYGTYLQFCMCYEKSVSFIEFLMAFCMYDDIFDTIRITDNQLLHFKFSKSGQILCVDKTSFSRPSHIYNSSLLPQTISKLPNCVDPRPCTSYYNSSLLFPKTSLSLHCMIVQAIYYKKYVSYMGKM